MLNPLQEKPPPVTKRPVEGLLSLPRCFSEKSFENREVSEGKIRWTHVSKMPGCREMIRHNFLHSLSIFEGGRGQAPRSSAYARWRLICLHARFSGIGIVRAWIRNKAFESKQDAWIHTPSESSEPWPRQWEEGETTGKFRRGVKIFERWVTRAFTLSHARRMDGESWAQFVPPLT